MVCASFSFGITIMLLASSLIFVVLQPISSTIPLIPSLVSIKSPIFRFLSRII